MLLSVGEILIDFIPGSEPGSYVRKAGGAPANVAVAAAKNGCNSAFCGRVGDDDFGRFLTKIMVDNGVVMACPKPVTEAVTTMAFVTLDSSGDRSFTFARKPGADMFLSREDIGDDLLLKSDIVHAGSCSLSKGSAADATAYALKKASELGRLVSFDVNYRNLLWDNNEAAAGAAVKAILPFVDLLKISEEEADMLGGEGSLTALAQENGIAVIVETLGKQGARCFWKGETIFAEPLPAKSVDTTGAGDAFWGTFLSVLIKDGVKRPEQLTEELLKRALRRGNIAGALCVQKKGAIEAFPTAEEIDSLL